MARFFGVRRLDAALLFSEREIGPVIRSVPSPVANRSADPDTLLRLSLSPLGAVSMTFHVWSRARSRHTDLT